eukprot:746404-Hanusia_phi.AAC.5
MDREGGKRETRKIERNGRRGRGRGGRRKRGESDSAGQVTKVVCGSEITCAITEEGQLFLWGSENSMGLGGNQARDTANPYAPKEVEGLDRLEQVAVGSMHIVARVVSLTCDDANDEE